MASTDVLIRLRLNGERAVEAGLVGVGRASRSLGADVSMASVSMRGFGLASDGVRRAVSATKTTIMATSAAVAALGVKGTFAGLGFNAAFQSANTSFATMLGSTRQARAFVEDLRTVSAGTPLRLTEVMDAAKRMLGMEMSAGRTVRVLKSLNAAVLATGGNSETFQQAALALGQIQAKGKGSAEELMQLAEAGVPVQKILQRQLGLTADEVADIARSGISAERVIDAIARGWSTKYGRAAERARGDWNNQVAGMKKDWEQLQRVVSGPLFRFLNRRVFPRLSVAIRLGIRGMERGGLPGLFAGLDRGLGAGGRIVSTFEAIQSAVRDTAAAIRDWFLPGAKAAVQWVRDLPTEAKLGFAGFAAVAALAFGGPLVWVGALIAAAVLVHKHWAAISTFFVGLWETVTNASDAAATWVKTAWGNAIRWVSDLFGLGGEDVKRVFAALRNVIGVWFLAIKTYLSLTLPAWKAIFEHGILPVVKRTFEGIVQIARGFARVVGGVVKLVSGILTGDFGAAWDGVKQIFSGAAQVILGSLKAITAPARTAIEGIWKGLAALAKGAFGAVKAVVEDAINFLIGRVRTILDIYNQIPDALKPGGDIALPEYVGEKGRQERAKRRAIPAPRGYRNPLRPVVPLPFPIAGAGSTRTLNLQVGVNVDRREIGRATVRGVDDNDQWGG